jgi:hypothetical protein
MFQRFVILPTSPGLQKANWEIAYWRNWPSTPDELLSAQFHLQQLWWYRSRAYQPNFGNRPSCRWVYFQVHPWQRTRLAVSQTSKCFHVWWLTVWFVDFPEFLRQTNTWKSHSQPLWTFEAIGYIMSISLGIKGQCLDKLD